MLGSGRGRRRKKGGRDTSVGPVLSRQAGWRNNAAAPLHVARQSRGHVTFARSASPAWHSCRATACACRATRADAGKGVTGWKKTFGRVNFKNNLEKVKIKKIPALTQAASHGPLQRPPHASGLPAMVLINTSCLEVHRSPPMPDTSRTLSTGRNEGYGVTTDNEGREREKYDMVGFFQLIAT